MQWLLDATKHPVASLYHSLHDLRLVQNEGHTKLGEPNPFRSLPPWTQNNPDFSSWAGVIINNCWGKYFFPDLDVWGYVRHTRKKRERMGRQIRQEKPEIWSSALSLRQKERIEWEMERPKCFPLRSISQFLRLSVIWGNKGSRAL